jgi:hypothetical protein
MHRSWHMSNTIWGGLDIYWRVLLQMLLRLMVVWFSFLWVQIGQLLTLAENETQTVDNGKIIYSCFSMGKTSSIYIWIDVIYYYRAIAHALAYLNLISRVMYRVFHLISASIKYLRGLNLIQPFLDRCSYAKWVHVAIEMGLLIVIIHTDSSQLSSSILETAGNKRHMALLLCFAYASLMDIEHILVFLHTLDFMCTYDIEVFASCRRNIPIHLNGNKHFNRF